MPAKLASRLVFRAAIRTIGFAVAALPVAAQSRITSPKEQFGFSIGDDYQLATYAQLTEYWKKVDAESDRVQVVSIGKTAEGRDQWMAIITSPTNLGKLDRYRDIVSRLARGHGLTDDAARALAKEGKTVVWIDGGLHATETLGAQQLIEHLYQMASRTDEETIRFLDDVIQLVVHANPDGMELVSSWYMRNSDPTKRSMSGIPRLYQKYIGHDNNRDFYMNAMPESKNMSRVMYRQWYPQIMYNHHQTGPSGSVMFAPPFRDPHNYVIDPLVINTLNMVGNAMHTRFSAENKPGVVQRESASYQTWWNGGLRTTAYFHNMVGILTETIGSPTPGAISVVPDRLVADGNGTFPIMPQPWKFRQSIEYEMTANRAIIDYASRYREQLLFNTYLMARNAIQKGGQDTWTIYPSRVARLQEAMRSESSETGGGSARPDATQLFTRWLRRPEDRDPRGYVLPSDQPDFLTATKFVNALIESGIEVQHATQSFSAGNKTYPAGSYVIRSAQAFRAHILDMLEPQDYPNDIPYPGGPPVAPYDNAGYTLAMSMGVRYDRQFDAFECPCTPIADVLAKPPVTVTLPSARTYALDRRVNDSYLAVNRLLARGQTVELVSGSSEIRVPATAEATRVLRELVDQRGLPVRAASARAEASAAIQPYRVGLWDTFGGSMASGWVRWILEQFEYPFDVVFAPTLDEGNLNQKYQALVFVSGAISPPRAGARPPSFSPPADLPAEYQKQIGSITSDKTIPAIKSFLEKGGRVITIGSSTALSQHLGLPIGNHLVERSATGDPKPLPREKFYVPGSVLEVAVDSTAVSALGMGSRAMVMFDGSPVFRLPPNAAAQGMRAVAWFDSPKPLKSGWAWGQTYLEGGVTAVEAKVGQGTLYLFGPEITYRSQPHGTYRLLFNAIWGK